MAEETFDIGYCDIQTATLQRYGEKETFSIANYISQLTFNESIHSPLLTGELHLIDSSGLLDNYPLLGEEIFTLKYVDFFEKEITQQFLIYGLNSYKSNDQQNTVFYRLQFISPQHFLSTSKNIQKSYSNYTIKEMIEKVFNEYLVDETNFRNSANEIDIEDTTNTQTLIIPALQPIEAINFLRRKAYSADSKSSNYYFFQNREKFKVKTHEQMIEDSKPTAKIYTYDASLRMDSPTEKIRAMNNLTSFYVPNRLNTIDEMNAGAMVSDVIEVDIQNKQYIHNVYKYKDNYLDYTHLDKTVRFPHTQKFTDDFFGDENVIKSFMIFKDFERQQQNYKDITGPRMSNRYYLSSIIAEVELYGRNDLFAGDVIKLDLREFENTPERKNPEAHESLSGYWLVNIVNHNISGKQYTCKVTLTKDLVQGNKGGVSTIKDIST
jgi:hypothetical protein